MKNIYILILILLTNIHLYSSDLIIEEGAISSQDSGESHKIVKSLNGLLEQKESPNSENDYILKSQLLETSILIDELKGIEKNKELGEEHFYRPYLKSLIKMNEDYYKIKLYYQGTYKNSPKVRAIFSLNAKKVNDKYYFFSPLINNTTDWKKSTLHKNTFYFKRELDIVKAQDYLSYIHKYDELIGNEPQESTFYFADDFVEALNIIGVVYKSDYSQVKYNSLYSSEKGELLIVNGTVLEGSAFDKHDLWHSRLRLALNPKDIYKPVDEGCAFLFGGSWGYSWENILSRFKKYIDDNPDANWLELQSKNVNYGTEKGKDLLVNYTVNALIVKKIMQEKGFESVRKLVSIGREQENLDKYFETLSQLTGINRSNFNQEIEKLIKEM